MAVAAVKRNLTFVWAKETDPKETYEFEFASDTQWSCVRNSWQGPKKFRVRYDLATSRIWWGDSYFLDAIELETKADRCCWYRVSDKDNPKKRPSFVWLRTAKPGPSVSQGKGSGPGRPVSAAPSARPTEFLTPEAVIKAVAKKQASQALRPISEPPSRGGTASKDASSALKVDREYFARRAASSVASPPSPEVILDLEQIAVIYKPPYWKCELPPKDVPLQEKTSGPQTLLIWIKDKMTDIDQKLFEEEFNPALSGTGFGPLSHRIDQETSGPLLVAKTVGAQRHLKSQFHQTSVSKQYVCLVHGKLLKQSGTIDAKIRTLRTGHMSRSEVSSAGEWAHTDFEVIATYNSIRPSQAEAGFKGYSLVACRIKTGRTHQIRVHMLSLGHPLVADDKYLSTESLQEDRPWCPRLFLHCYRLGFRNIKNDPELVICPLPDDLKGALVRLGAAEISAHASDLLFGETSWQRDLFRPPATSWRPGTKVLRRVAAFIGSSGEAVLLSKLRADDELQKWMSEEGNDGILGRAWLAKHYDIFEVLAEAEGSDVSVRLRAAHSAEAASVERDVERQEEAVRSELEDLERQKQRAIAEEDYARAAEIKRRIGASRAELASLHELLSDAQDDPDVDFPTYAEERAVRRGSERRKTDAFTQDVKDEMLFPSLVSLTARHVPMKPSVASAVAAGGVAVEAAAAGSASAGATSADTKDSGILPLREALIDFLRPREGKVAHINEINNDKFMRQVMAAQQPRPIQAVNKAWLKHHEDMFAFLRTADNEIYIALCEAAQKKSGKATPNKAGAALVGGAGGEQQPKAPAYRQVVQKTGGEGDPKPLVYEYSTTARAEKGASSAQGSSQGAVAWQESFKEALEKLPLRCCPVQELLTAVPLFAAAMGAKRAWEQKELLVMFLETFPDKFKIERRGSGADKQYTVMAR
mmetsp:Transcript_55542/g.159730  ORF Transcript_55542/g.159730 Transcript_55542/m.159730 type:complete len:929 (-) Transcript_55542:37-2823(-)|eukprot:CAMPEP_0177217590 /NCGR_PEP_ID=MMETSP0367-20130122/35366_1 /TAXON_ID=447022 ORGANISM="Scrippsiella hangoei-like, Strain SHHI-4" /NCGR_SAMPLE_ID=MMETSP0367 /ASSEMBLY_ACC=CAM_ASM_000362 /LENGTH=928 /DNA_ID=CAMNT_0018667171 /DNA_START=61 /DNA_END=2847 /DNA_ORIENTATION=+